MWFKLAGADFSKNNLGTMSSISSSYLIDYTGLTGMSGSPSSVSYAGSSAGTSKTVSVVVTVTSGYTFKSGSTITASGGKSGTVFTAGKDYTGGQTFTFSMAITANTKLTGAAEATGGSSSGGSGGTTTNYTFTINPTPTSATVTLSATGYSTVSGTGNQSITVANGTSVSWSVSASEYSTQSGTWTVNGSNKTENVTLSAAGSTVQLTSSNANSAYADSANHLNNAQTLGAPLAKSNVGTKGIIGWDIPQYALVTLTVSSGGNYGMAITDTNDAVIESFSNGSVATDGDGTYVFSPVLEASRLYVSTTKFVSASYVILSDEELTQYGFNARIEFTSDRAEGKYINTTQTVGNDVQFAEMNGTQYGISQTIPANSVITLNVATGGNYGMCIADENGKVLQNKPSNKADADGNIVFDKQSVPCKLWVSMTKFKKATYKLGG